MFPLVSVIIPTYNTATYLAYAIESALGQSLKNVEIIVVDDGSTDETVNILQPYKKIIRYIYQPNAGRSAARNTGILQAQGKYIAFLDADDLWLPDRLAQHIPILEENPDTLLVYSQANVIDSQGNNRLVRDTPLIIGGSLNDSSQAVKQLLLGNFIPILTVTLRKSIFEQAGLFDDKLSYAEDWDLWLRIAELGKISFVPGCFACYRVESADRPASFWASTDSINQQIYVLNKFFDRRGSISNEIKRLGYAWIYVRAALAAMQLDDLSSGSLYWSRALQVEPAFLSPGTIRQIIQKVVFTAYGYEIRQDYSGAIDFLSKIIQSLPVSLIKKLGIKRQLISQYLQSVVFYAHSIGDFKTVRKYLCPVLLSTPGLITNRGIWKIGLLTAVDKLKAFHG